MMNLGYYPTDDIHVASFLGAAYDEDFELRSFEDISDDLDVLECGEADSDFDEMDSFFLEDF
jgi:hypothetical protein